MANAVKNKRFVARVVLLALARAADQMAERYETEGKIQLSQEADRKANKLYLALKAAEEDEEEKAELSADELKDTLQDVMDLNEESRELIEEALGEEEEHEEEDEKEEGGEQPPKDEKSEGELPEEEIPFAGESFDDLPLAASKKSKSFGLANAHKQPPVTTGAQPIRKGYRIRGIR